MASAGYSGAPLAKKLSLKDGMRVWFDAMPESVRAEIGEVALIECAAPEPGLDAAHIFVTARGDMEAKLKMLLPLLKPRRIYLGVVAEEGIEGRDGYYRRHDPRGDPARDAAGRCKSLCCRCGVVGA